MQFESTFMLLAIRGPNLLSQANINKIHNREGFAGPIKSQLPNLRAEYTIKAASGKKARENREQKIGNTTTNPNQTISTKTSETH